MSDRVKAIAHEMHEAADRLVADGETPANTEVAEGIALFLAESTFSAKGGPSIALTDPSIGYGAVVGYLAAKHAERSRMIDELEDAATDCDGHTPYSILMALAGELRDQAVPQKEKESQ